MTRTARLTGIALTCWLGSASAAPNMTPGLWEIQVRTEMEGMPMQMPAVTTRQCIREQDLVPQTNTSGQECEIVDQDFSSDQVTWRIQCRSADMQGEGTGRIRYHGNTFEGQMDMSMTQEGMGPMNMTQRLQGKRVGDCN